MTKIRFVGDTHADSNAALEITELAAQDGVDYIVQVGDFGFGFYHSGGKDAFLSDVSKYAVRFNVPWYWIDGNHDNHRRIWQEVDEEKYPSTFYMNRGTVHDLGGIKIGALGGATSIDKNFRKVDVDWWDTEEVTSGQMNRAIDTFLEEKPLIIVTHDAPKSFPVIHDDFIPTPGSPIWQAHRHRDFLQGLWDTLEENNALPEFWIHGHMHTKYVSPGACTRIGLGQSDTYGIYDPHRDPLWWSYTIDR